jgi:hypothetical protein
MAGSHYNPLDRAPGPERNLADRHAALGLARRCRNRHRSMARGAVRASDAGPAR